MSNPYELPFSIETLAMGSALIQALSGATAEYGLRGDLGIRTPYGPLAVPLDERGRVASPR